MDHFFCQKCMNHFPTDQYDKHIQKSNDPWENLKVGDVFEQKDEHGIGDIKIIEILENVVGYKHSMPEECVFFSGISWEEIKILKKEGWTIKDSTPKEEKKCPHVSIITCANCSGDYKFEPTKSEPTAEEKLEQIKRIL